MQLNDTDTATARRDSALLADLPGVLKVWPLGLVAREQLAQPDVIISAADVAEYEKRSEPEHNLNYPLAMTQVDQLHEKGFKGKGITIAIIDGGVSWPIALNFHCN